LDKIWSNIIDTAGYYNLSFIKIFDQFTSSSAANGSLKSCTFTLKKMEKSMGATATVKHFLAKLQNSYF
jgi:hypothetical protein